MMRLMQKKCRGAGWCLKGAKAAKRQQCYMSLRWNGLCPPFFCLAIRESAMDAVFHQVWAVAARRTAETKFASPLRQNHIVSLASDAGSAGLDLSRGVAPMAGFAATRKRCTQDSNRRNSGPAKRNSSTATRNSKKDGEVDDSSAMRPDG